MKELEQDQFDAINNIGFIFDQDNMNKALMLLISSQPKVTLETVDGYTIEKEEGEHGYFTFEGIPVGKLSAAYTETPTMIKVMLAAKIAGDENLKLLVWHFIHEDTSVQEED
jgi:hypothetical protein